MSRTLWRGKHGWAAPSATKACMHRISALLERGPEEAETAAEGAVEHAPGHQAAPADEAERNDNDPLDGASEETRNVVRMAVEIRRVNARCAALEEKVGKNEK